MKVVIVISMFQILSIFVHQRMNMQIHVVPVLTPQHAYETLSFFRKTALVPSVTYEKNRELFNELMRALFPSILTQINKSDICI